MLLSGTEISRRNIISPHAPRMEITRGTRKLSYGESICGYDVRCEFDSDGSELDVYLMPGEFKLVSTLEHFTMPLDVCGFVRDKSSWARRGLSVFNTVIEPGWKGFLTIELINQGAETIHLRHGDPIAQIQFELIHALPSVEFQGYSGKYQNQERGPQQAR